MGNSQPSAQQQQRLSPSASPSKSSSTAVSSSSTAASFSSSPSTPVHLRHFPSAGSGSAAFTNGHSSPHVRWQSDIQSAASAASSSPPYTVAYYTEALEKQELTPAFFLSASPASSSSSSPPSPSSAGQAASQSPSSSFDLIAYADIARLLLSSHPSLSLWRYKLVPARINEFHFWKNVFDRLNRLQPELAAQQHSRDNSKLQQPEEHKEDQQQQQQQHHLRRSSHPPHVHALTTASSPAPSSASSGLQAHVATLEQQIALLTSELQHKDSTIAALTAQLAASTPSVSSSAAAASSSPPSPSSPHYHPGRWSPDKQTVEFLSLEPSLRDTLRQQKAKRVADVRREMRWIVDGDRMEDGPGRWSCCQTEDWTARGCREKR